MKRLPCTIFHKEKNLNMGSKEDALVGREIARGGGTQISFNQISSCDHNEIVQKSERDEWNCGP
jgi:hypothetical protein